MTCDPVTGEPYVNRGELARAFKTTEPTIDRWIVAGCPVVEKGSNGRAYKSLTSQVRAWRTEVPERESAELVSKEAAIRQEQLKLVGGRPGDSPMALAPRQSRELWEEELTYKKAAVRRGELVPAHDDKLPPGRRRPSGRDTTARNAAREPATPAAQAGSRTRNWSGASYSLAPACRRR